MCKEKTNEIIEKLERIEVRLEHIDKRLEQAEKITDPVHTVADTLTEKIINMLAWLIIAVSVGVAWFLVHAFGPGVVRYIR